MRLPPLAGATLLAIAALAASAPARAAYIVTFTQAGTAVVASGSGTLDTKGLAFSFSTIQAAGIQPSAAAETAGATAPSDLYSGVISGPRSFGTGGLTFATTGTGDLAGFDAAVGGFVVPHGYVSGAFLSDTATYAAATFASLGLTPGSYVYGFGSGATADTITVDIGATPSVPEPVSAALLGAGLLGLGRARRQRRGA